MLRVDSGVWSNDTIATLGRLGVRYTMAVRTGNTAITNAISQIADDAWVDIDYTLGGHAQVAECRYKGRRLVVRRTRLTNTAQAALWPDWRHHAFLTDLNDDTVTVDQFHRRHAVVELAIRFSGPRVSASAAWCRGDLWATFQGSEASLFGDGRGVGGPRE